MTSYYLTDQAAAHRRAALIERLAAEAMDLSPHGLTWPPDSDYWRLPEAERQAVADFTVERLVRS